MLFKKKEGNVNVALGTVYGSAELIHRGYSLVCVPTDITSVVLQAIQTTRWLVFLTIII